MEEIQKLKLEVELKYMNQFIQKHGEAAFKDAVFNHAFNEVAYSYIHPTDELRTTENFSIIHNAFVNAYV